MKKNDSTLPGLRCKCMELGLNPPTIKHLPRFCFSEINFLSFKYLSHNPLLIQKFFSLYTTSSQFLSYISPPTSLVPRHMKNHMGPVNEAHHYRQLLQQSPIYP